jgi:hypothetical protein
MRLETYICFPPKIKRCCTGGMPSFSSTFSLICATFVVESCQQAVAARFRYEGIYPIVWLNVEFDLLSRQSSDSVEAVSSYQNEMDREGYLINIFGDFCDNRSRLWLVESVECVPENLLQDAFYDGLNVKFCQYH